MIKKHIKHILLIVAGVILFAFSMSTYIQAGKHLTPSSVGVSGYYRSDGTYVRPYNRRPPGGAIHDAPYESQRTLCLFLMVLGTGIIVFPAYLIRKDIKGRNSVNRKEAKSITGLVRRHDDTQAVLGLPNRTLREDEGLRQKVLSYQRAVARTIELDNTILSTCRHNFGEAYGPSGLLICAYAEVIAKATVENSRSRRLSELPSSLEAIKEAITELIELVIARSDQDNSAIIEPLRIAYSFLARFLPERQARLVTERNLGWLAEDPNHPGLQRSEEAEEIEAEVDAEEERLEQEFDEMLIEALENERAKAQRAKAKAEREFAAMLLELSSDDPDLVVEELLDEFRKSDTKEGTSNWYGGNALIAWRQEDRKTALQLFTKCIELDPNDGVAFLNRGNLQIELGFFDAGISDLEKARDIDPELPWQNAMILKMLGSEEREAMRQRMLEKRDRKRT